MEQRPEKEERAAHMPRNDKLMPTVAWQLQANKLNSLTCMVGPASSDMRAGRRRRRSTGAASGKLRSAGQT